LSSPLVAELRDYWLPAEPVILNIIGGLLTVVVLCCVQWLARSLHHHKFRAIFHAQGDAFFIASGSLVIHPFVLSSIPNNLSTFQHYPFTKESNHSNRFSAEVVSSFCEIRAAAYLTSALGIDGRMAAYFESDERLKEKLDVDFISLGAISNLKTLDVLMNENNNLVDFDSKTLGFVSKRNGRPLFGDLGSFDYGVILLIHPKQFPTRTWIACAGIGEWGTSGSAWFLAKKWRVIQKRISRGEQFAASIKVRRGQDESAELVLPLLT
jgi:hypothetical protein